MAKSIIPAKQSHRGLILAGVGLAVIFGIVLYEVKKSSAATPTPTPTPTPSNLPTTGDVWGALNAQQQGAVIAALQQYAGANDRDLTQANNRAVAISNFQQAKGVIIPSGDDGVLDIQTYQALGF